MTRFTRRVFIAVFVVAIIIINIAAWRWSSGYFFSRHNSTLLRYGSPIPKLKGQSLVGRKPIELPTNRTNLVLYFSSVHTPGLSIELVKYAEILSRRYGKQGLGVSAIVQPNVDELTTLIEHSLVNYDVMVDQNRQAGEKLGLAPNENGVFLFDRQGLCRFAARRPVNAGDLRQLVATEFLGENPSERPTVTQQEIQQGKHLGSWSIVDIRSWELTNLEKIRSATPQRFVFFTAECSVCSLPGYLDQLEELEKREREAGIKELPTLVFDYNFSANNVIEQLETHNIKSHAYIADEQLLAAEDLVRAGALNDAQVFAVQTDVNGVVQSISALKSLVADRSADAITAQPEVKRSIEGARYEEVFSSLALTAYDVAAYQGKYILTDFTGNRILIVGDQMQVEREFGKIGSGPGRLLHPGFLDVAGDGTIYVEDGGNERIVKFTQDGRYVGELPIANYDGLAVGPRNELYVSQPEEEGQLITVYSSSGRKLRSFGLLKKFSEINGPEFADKDLPYKFAFNRVRLATDVAGNLYVSFTLTPLLQKYSPNGDLLFETRLEGPEIDRLMVAIQKRKYITSPVEGAADGRIIALDPVIEPSTGNIFVPLVDGSIYVADGNGKRLMLLHPHAIEQHGQTFYPFVAGLGAKGELLVNPFPPKHWYRLVIPSASLGKNPGPVAGNESRLSGR